MVRQKVKKHSPHETFDSVPSRLPSSQDRPWAEQLLEELITRERSLSLRLERARQLHIVTTTEVLHATRARIANIRCFLAPIRLLPVELLSHILQIAFNNGQSPWTFAHVSRSFRRVTFNTPLMWNQISFCTNPTARRNEGGVEMCHSPQALLDAFERSRKTLLTLTIELKLPRGGDLSLEVIYSSLSPVLNTAADRIRSLTILDQGFDYSIPFPYFFTRCLKSLRSLHISGATKPRRCFEALLNLVDRTALDLRVMKLLVSPTFVTPERACWKRLTNLELQGLPPLAVISQCLSLRHLRLRINPNTTGSTEPLPPTPIILPSLKSLNMEFFPVALLRSLSLPALLTLEIDSTHHAVATEAFPPFPSLVSLKLKGRFQIDPSVFIAPALTFCTISGVRLGGSVITTPKHYKEWPSPSILTDLKLESIVDEADAILPMLRHHTDILHLSLILVSSTPSAIKSLWHTVLHSTSDSPAPFSQYLKTLYIKFRSHRYKQVAISGMLHALAMVRESAGLPLETLSFHQFRRGIAVHRELLPLSIDHQEADSDSDQSTCDACHGYHG